MLISDIREALLSNAVCMSVLGKSNTDKEFLSVKTFLTDDSQDKRISDAISKIRGTLLESTAIAKLSYKLPVYQAVRNEFGEYYRVKSQLYLAKTLINAMASLGSISRIVNGPIRRFDEETGEISFYTEVLYEFPEKEADKDITTGLHLESGQLVTRVVKVKPGGVPYKLTSEEKTFMKDISTNPLRLVRVSEDVLRDYYQQTAWYQYVVTHQGEPNVEDRILLDLRIDKYISIIMGYMSEEELFLSVWNDSRRRLYYDLNMPGISPQGDSFETHMWELSKPIIIDDNGGKDLIWAAVVLAAGRKNHSRSLAYWKKNEAAVRAAIVDPDKWDYGELFYHQRLLQAIDDWKSGTPSHFILGYDATSGGLQRFSLAYHSAKSMKLSNVGGLKSVRDAHGAMGDIFGVLRKIAKKINTPLIHGSTFDTLIKVLLQHTGKAFSRGMLQKKIVDLYGKEILNIDKIATYGSLLYNNANTSLQFKAKDGWKCQSIAYSPSVAVDVYGLDPDKVKGWSKSIVHRDMPLLLTRKGQPVNTNSKLRGLFANITHTVDGWFLREIYRAVRKPILFKHDKFYTHPNHIQLIRARGKELLVEEYKENRYANSMFQIKDNYHGSLIVPSPEFIIGNGTLKMVEGSDNFLMP